MKCSHFFPTIAALLSLPSLTLATTEEFESQQPGAFGSIQIASGTLSAKTGHAEIKTGNSRNGTQSLRLLGGEEHSAEIQLTTPLAKGGELGFWAERWTRASPFSFEIEARIDGAWSSIYTGDKTISTGGFNTEVRVLLAEGTEAVRLTSTTPDNTGVLIDDLNIEPAEPMQITSASTIQPVVPTMVRLENNPVVAVVIDAKGPLEARSVKSIQVSTIGTTTLADVKSVRVFYSGTSAKMTTDTAFGREEAPTELITFKGNQELSNGANHFWVSFEMNDDADINSRVDAGISAIALDDGRIIELDSPSPAGTQRIGVCVAKNGDGQSKFFRIPGMATTTQGTLIAVYDNRYRHGGDLPADIDIGMNRSTDGGKTWTDNKVIMDMGDDPKHNYDGIGDPAVLVDKANNRIWVAALWSHGNRGWNGSGPGMKPEETAQFVLVYSDDDGVNWSKPINITRQVKRKEWRLFFNGPGNGIAMKDGTLVFPAQYRDAEGMPWSNLIYSKDHGKTWHSGLGAKSNTTEAQLVELADGSIMINCRDNRGGSRTIATTKDLGKTWTLHPTDRKDLNEPVCMASLIRTEHKTLGDLLIFSNPNTPRPGKKRGRYDMTLKISKDEGMSWPEQWHTLYDSRPSAGYSCLSMADDDHVGVLYEGVGLQLFYLRIPLAEILK